MEIISTRRPGVPFFRLALATGLAGVVSAVTAAPSPTITVSWRDKPPYHYLEGATDQGFLLKRIKDVFATAGLRAEFVEQPQKRIWANFEHGAANYCSISWYRLPEREAVARYSHAIHTDAPHVVLASPAAAQQVQAHGSLASLMADRKLTLGVMDGVSYGGKLDAMISGSENRVMRRTVSVTGMLRMLSAGRMSYVLVDREDWQYLSKNEASLAPLVPREFADMPAGLDRHLVCSRDIKPAVMDKLNRAIAGIGRGPR